MSCVKDINVESYGIFQILANYYKFKIIACYEFHEHTDLDKKLKENINGLTSNKK
jgi:hypothetical protein